MAPGRFGKSSDAPYPFRSGSSNGTRAVWKEVKMCSIQGSQWRSNGTRAVWKVLASRFNFVRSEGSNGTRAVWKVKSLRSE